MTIYFPVLRWKLGERSALANLAPDVKQHITPIIEFPIDCDYNDRKVTDFCETAASSWGTDQAFYLELSTVDFTSAPIDEEHPALKLFQTSNEKGLQIIPVINPNMDPDLFLAIVQAYNEQLFETVSIRINENDDDQAIADATDMLTRLNLNREDVDLIIDLGNISNGAVQAKIRILNTLLNAIGNNYRKTIVISAAMPSDLQDYIGTNEAKELPRHDWQLWLRVLNNPNTSYILFGDYVTIPYVFREVSFQGAPKIKYTLENSWYIIKGYRPRGRDNQRQQQSQQIINSSFYRGQNYSFGDQRIYECANGTWGPGNPTNWVTIDISQHITYVVFQVSSAISAT